MASRGWGVAGCLALFSLAVPAHSTTLHHKGSPIRIETDFEALASKYFAPSFLEISSAVAANTSRVALRGDRKYGEKRKGFSDVIFTNFLEVSAEEDPATGENELAACEVCTYVMDNKMQRQPYLCRGLKDPAYQRSCVQVMESLIWWLSNEVYWVNYGCQKNQEGSAIWLRPCPAHAVCSWLQHLYTRAPMCPEDPSFPVPK